MGLLAPPQSHDTIRSKFKYFLAAIFVALVASFIFSPASASAADSYRWSNQDTITATVAPLGQQSDLFLYGPERGSTISFKRPLGPYTGDGERRYIGTVKRGNCEGKLILTVSADSKGTGTVRTDPTSCLLGGGQLGQLGKTITIGNVSAATKTGDDVRQECAALQLPYNESTGTCGGITNPGNGDGDGAPAEEEEDKTAEGLLCGGITSNIRWAACPLTMLLTEIMQGVESALHQLLTTDTSLFDNPGYQGAWAAFRTIAFSLIVIAGLVIVIGQAAGIQVLDAYTIKKAVPRLVLAVLFVSLSWPLLELVVTVNDNIARLLQGIILSPFNGVDSEYGRGESVAAGVGNWLAIGGIVGLLTPILAGSTILASAWGILGSFLIVGVAGILIAFLVIGLRAVLITVCIIAAPLAIACSILPATEKVFGLWRKTLISCLLVYPLIILLLTAGKVGALMSSDGIMSILLYLVPYFAIPFAFTMVGGAIGKLAGIANNVNTGLFDSQRKKREALRGRLGMAAKSGSGFKENGRFGLAAVGRGVNRTGGAIGVGGINGLSRLGGGERGNKAIDQHQRGIANELMKDPRFAAIQEEDDTLTALGHIGNGLSKDNAIRTMVAQGMDQSKAVSAYAAAKATGLDGRTASIAAAQQRVLTGTGYAGYTKADGTQVSAYDQMMETFGAASGGNTATAESLGGFANALAKTKGRHDLAPGGGVAAADARAAAQEYATGRKHTPAADIHNPAHLDKVKKAFNSGSLYQIANGKASQFQTFTPAFAEAMNRGMQHLATTGEVTPDLESALVYQAELKAAKNGGSGDSNEAMNQALEQMNAIQAQYTGAPGGGPRTAQQELFARQRGGAYVTAQNQSQTAARSYERPDPSLM